MFQISKNKILKKTCFVLFFIPIFGKEIKNKEQMRIALSHNSIMIIKHRGNISQYFGGVHEKNKLELNINSEKNLTQISNEKEKEKEKKEKSEKSENSEIEKEKEKEKNKKTYKLNKKKIRKKCLAFGSLDQSKKFIGFYSISFPLGILDEIARRILNVFLTKLREKFNLTNYLWIAERQKNKTIHFHLLTNNYMPIKEVNREMAKTIDYYVSKQQASWGNSSFEKYNGVDLQYPNKNKKNKNQKSPLSKKTQKQNIKFLSKYLTKYITKQDQSWFFLPQHYSHSISNLATGYLLDLEEAEIFKKNVLRSLEVFNVYSNDFCDVIIPLNPLPESLLYPLLHYNQKIFNRFAFS